MFRVEATLRGPDDGGSGAVTHVAVLRPDRVVAYVSNELVVWDRSVGLVRTIDNLDTVQCLKVHSDNRCLSGHRNAELREWNLAISSARCEVQSISTGQESVNCVDVLPDRNRHVVSGGSDYSLKVWDLGCASFGGGSCLATLSSAWLYRRGWFECVAGLPDGRVASADEHGAIKVWAWAEGRCILELNEDEDSIIDDLRALPGDKLMSSGEGALKFWCLSEERCLTTLTGPRGHLGGCIDILPDGRVVSVGWDNTIKVWDLTAGRIVQTIACDVNLNETMVNSVAALPDDRFVVAFSVHPYYGRARGTPAIVKVFTESPRKQEKRMAEAVTRTRACGDVAKLVAAFL